MKRYLVILIALAGLSMAFLPGLNAEEWDEARTRLIKLDDREAYRSPVFKPQAISGDFVSIPTEEGKLKVKITRQKVLVDVKGTGKPDFTAAQGVKSKIFPLKLHYEGDVTNHYYARVMKDRTWVFMRACAIEARLGRDVIYIVDENSNGVYGEEGQDAIYIDKKHRGGPFSNIVTVGGNCYEIQVNPSATEVKYREYAGETGEIDINKGFKAKKKLETVIVKGQSDSGMIFIDVVTRRGTVKLPTGSYSLVRGYMDMVEIGPGNSTSFEVTSGEPATMEWGMDLKIETQLSVRTVKGRKMFTLNPRPMPRVVGSAGEVYGGEYMDDARFAFKVYQATANGRPIGRPTTWSPCFS